jgi:hypothetical protein
LVETKTDGVEMTFKLVRSESGLNIRGLDKRGEGPEEARGQRWRGDSRSEGTGEARLHRMYEDVRSLYER